MKILVAVLAAVLALGPGLSEARSKKHPHSHPPASVSGTSSRMLLSTGSATPRSPRSATHLR